MYPYGSIRVYSIDTGETISVEGHSQEVGRVFWHDDGRQVISTTGRKETFLWNTANWTILKRILRPSDIVVSPLGDVAGLIVGERVFTGDIEHIFEQLEELAQEPEGEMQEGNEDSKVDQA